MLRKYLNKNAYPTKNNKAHIYYHETKAKKYYLKKKTFQATKRKQTKKLK